MSHLRRILIAVLCTAGLVLLGARGTAVGAPLPSVTVSGHAYLAGQSDHSGIKVLFQAQPGTGHTDSTLTNAQGAYGLPINVGIYLVHFSKNGYVPADLPGLQFISQPVVLPDVTLQAGSIMDVSGCLQGTLTHNYVYRVVGDIRVCAGDTLIVEPGVEFRFAGPYSFIVEGATVGRGGLLVAQGTAADSIRFTSDRNPAAPGDWGGLDVRSAEDNVLNFAAVEYPARALTMNATAGARLRAENTSFRFGAQGWLLNGERLDLVDCRLSGHMTSTAGVIRLSGSRMIGDSNWTTLQSSADSLTVEDCVLDCTQSGEVLYQQGGTLIAQRNFIRTINGFAVYDAAGLVLGNRLVSPHRYGTALNLLGTRIPVQRNTISGFNGALNLSDDTSSLSGAVTSNVILNCGTGVEQSASSRLFIAYNDLFHNVVNYSGSTPIGIGAVITTNTKQDSCDVYYNLYLDPAMADTTNADFHLTAGSPCIDTGDPSLPVDPDGTTADMGALYYPQGTLNPPAAGFAAAPTAGQAPMDVRFTDTSTGPVDTYAWDFGDGRTSAESNPDHVFSEAGTFPVSLTVTGPGGTNTKTTSGAVTTTAPSPPHAPPTCDFQGSPLTGYGAGLNVHFVAQVTGQVTTYLWNFGDGGSGTDAAPWHLYSQPGVYSVALTVSNAHGGTTTTKTGYIRLGDDYNPPAADFTADHRSGSAPVHTCFAFAGYGHVTHYAWDFGDGGSDTSRAPCHDYRAAGSFTVSLTVTGPGGQGSKSSPDFVVVTSPLRARAFFSVSDSVGINPLSVTFVNRSTGAVDSAAWTFGDGSGSRAWNPTHVYANPGSFRPRLIVGGLGGVDTLIAATPILVTGPAPTILSVSDVPNDQGGRVWVRWIPNGLDTSAHQEVVGYSVLERDAQGGWFETGSALAQQLPVYTSMALTLADSTASAPEHAVFMVIAHTLNPGVFYTSEPDSGASVDNLAPGVPKNLDGQINQQGNLRLNWTGGPEHDRRYFEIHRGFSGDFTPTDSTLIGRSVDPTFVDPAWPGGYIDLVYEYRIVAVDFAGNRSVPSIAWAAPDTPVLLSLLSASTTIDGVTLEWQVAEGIEVTAFDVYRKAVSEPTAIKLNAEPLSAPPGATRLTYQDLEVDPNTSYTYTVRGYLTGGRQGDLGSLAVTTGAIERDFSLLGARPNPFRGNTSIYYRIPNEGRVTLEIYDPAGRLVRRFGPDEEKPGTHHVAWEAVGSDGRAPASGVYFVRLRAGGETATRRVALIR